MGRLRAILERILADAGFALAAVGGLALLAAQGGRLSDWLDVLTHFAPIWMGLAATGLLLCLAAPREVLAPPGIALAVLGLASGLTLTAPEFVRSAGPQAPADGAPVFKVVQFNAWSMRLTDHAAIAEWLAAQDAEVIVLQESNRKLNRIVAARTGYHLTCASKPCMVSIFTRAAPLDTRIPDQTAGSYVPMNRVTTPWPGGPVTVVGVHYTWPAPAGRQQAQGRSLAAVIEQLPRDRLIVTGDFNSTPWSFSRRREDRRFNLPRRTRAVFSWPAGKASGHRIPIPIALLPIDHVYAGPGLATVRIARGPRLESDHHPIVAEFAAAD